jgi:hypothetical protein
MFGVFKSTFFNFLIKYFRDGLLGTGQRLQLTPTLLPIKDIVDIQTANLTFARTKTKIYMWGPLVDYAASPEQQQKFLFLTPTEIPLLSKVAGKILCALLTYGALFLALDNGCTYSFGKSAGVLGYLNTLSRGSALVDLMNEKEDFEKAKVPYLDGENIDKMQGNLTLIFGSKGKTKFIRKYGEVAPLAVHSNALPLEDYNCYVSGSYLGIWYKSEFSDEISNNNATIKDETTEQPKHLYEASPLVVVPAVATPSTAPSTGSFWEKFLTDAGLDADSVKSYSDAFMENEVEPSQVKQLSLEFLSMLGVKKVGHQMKIMAQVARQ